MARGSAWCTRRDVRLRVREMKDGAQRARAWLWQVRALVFARAEIMHGLQQFAGARIECLSQRDLWDRWSRHVERAKLDCRGIESCPRARAVWVKGPDTAFSPPPTGTEEALQQTNLPCRTRHKRSRVHRLLPTRAGC